ncbi:MAG: Ku protein [Propionivibrio sp.]
MAAASRRVLWKGAIAFGLVHIPIALHSATSEQALNFDWLDRRRMDPVGYKRVNKKTGKEIDRGDIVKGIEVEDGQYVVLSPEEISAAYPKSTQTIEIECFVDAGEIPNLYLERPYYVSPINRGAKVYALLREVLRKTGKVGVAKVVIQTKQHLAMLMPCGPALVLNLLRWGDEIRPLDELDLPANGVKAAGLLDKEMKMAEQLVADMSTPWQPDAFTDSFREQILGLVAERVKSGKTAAVTPVEASASGDAEPSSARIYDLGEMLQRSLDKLGGGGRAGKTGAAKDAPVKTATETTKRPAKAKPKPAAAKPASRRAG